MSKTDDLVRQAVTVSFRDSSGRETLEAVVDVLARGRVDKNPWGKDRPDPGDACIDVDQMEIGEVILRFGAGETRFASIGQIPDRALLERERNALKEQAIDAFLDWRDETIFEHPRCGGEDFRHPGLADGAYMLQPGGILERNEESGTRQFRSVNGELCERMVLADDGLAGDGLPSEWKASGQPAMADSVVRAFATHCGCSVKRPAHGGRAAASFGFAIEEFEGAEFPASRGSLASGQRPDGDRCRAGR